MAETAQAGMTMHNFDALSNHDVAEDGEEGEHRGHGRFAVDNEEGHMVDLEAIGQVADTGSTFVCVGDDDDFVASVYQFLPSSVLCSFLWRD